jgi:molybdopterin-binding protein
VHGCCFTLFPSLNREILLIETIRVTYGRHLAGALIDEIVSKDVFQQWEVTMELSARNQLKGTIKSIKKDSVMAEVVVDLGGRDIVAAITANSVERMGLHEGDEVKAIIKATEVMIAK